MGLSGETNPWPPTSRPATAGLWLPCRCTHVPEGALLRVCYMCNRCCVFYVWNRCCRCMYICNRYCSYRCTQHFLEGVPFCVCYICSRRFSWNLFLYNHTRAKPFLLSWYHLRRAYIYVMTRNQKNMIRRHKEQLFNETIKSQTGISEDAVFAARTIAELDEAYTRFEHLS